MPSFGAEPEAVGGRRQMVLAVVVLALAVATGQLSQAAQERIAFTLRASVLRPFIATQEVMTEARVRAGQVEVLLTRLDSLTRIVATQSALFDENRTLRDLLGLAERSGPAYLPTTVLRPGSEGSESIFLIDLGLEDGVRNGSAVVSARGLVGVIREARDRSSVGMDWSHPDFRASAMLVDGSVYGIVENRRGEFREQDRLLLNGAAYHADVPPGAIVVTSGLAGVLPRGIPIGRIDTIADEQGGWRKSYWLRPMVVPGAATHVLVVTTERGEDVSHAWPAPLLAAEPEADSIVPGTDGVPGRLAGVDAGATPTGAEVSRPGPEVGASPDGPASAARTSAGGALSETAGGDASDAARGAASDGAGGATSDAAGGATSDGAGRDASGGTVGVEPLPEPLVVPQPGPPPVAALSPLDGSASGGSTRGEQGGAPDPSVVRPPAGTGTEPARYDSASGGGPGRVGPGVPDTAAVRDSTAARDSVAGRDTLASDTIGSPRRDTTSVRESARPGGVAGQGPAWTIQRRAHDPRPGRARQAFMRAPPPGSRERGA